MNMVLYATNAIERTFVVFYDSPDVAVHLLAAALGDSHLTAIGVDDDVVNGIYCTHNNLS